MPEIRGRREYRAREFWKELDLEEILDYCNDPENIGFSRYTFQEVGENYGYSDNFVLVKIHDKREYWGDFTGVSLYFDTLLQMQQALKGMSCSL